MATFLAILKAIPILDSWFQSLMAFYIQTTIASMKQENLNAIKTAIQSHDQRPIETALGSSTAGKLSGDAGATVIDTPPPNVLS